MEGGPKIIIPCESVSNFSVGLYAILEANGF